MRSVAFFERVESQRGSRRFLLRCVKGCRRESSSKSIYEYSCKGRYEKYPLENRSPRARGGASHAPGGLCADGGRALLVRLRAVNLASANHDSTGLGLAIDDKVLPELDISSFWTREIATELVLTYNQKQTITSNNVRIGSLHHVPPTLTLQYHFVTASPFKPYVGAGINYTRFSNVSFDPAVDRALHPSIEKNSVGPAAQVGLDYLFSDHLSFNVDVKKVMLRTDIRSSGTRVGELRVDPWLVGVGFGWLF